MKRCRTRADLLADPRVEEIWQEADGCFHPTRPSYWLVLADGWNNEGASTLHEPTIAALCLALETVVRQGPTY